jgi:hypothetical protein
VFVRKFSQSPEFLDLKKQYQDLLREDAGMRESLLQGLTGRYEDDVRAQHQTTPLSVYENDALDD